MCGTRGPAGSREVPWLLPMAAPSGETGRAGRP